MAGFSATDAALTGFRIVWQRPKVLAVWAPVQFCLSLALTLFIATSAGPAFPQTMSLLLQPNPNPERVATLAREMAPTAIVLFSYVLITAAVINGAMNRAVFSPDDDRFGYLRLSTDELLQLALLAILGVAFYLSIVLTLAVVAAIAGFGPVGTLVALLALLAGIGGLIFLAVRLSLAPALTFASRRIRVAESWRLTNGHFWPLLGAYFAAFALRFVVFGLTLAIAAAAAGIATMAGGGPSGAHRNELVTVSEILAPSGLIDLAISAFGQALAWPILITPPAVIYRALAGGGPGAAGRALA